METIQELISFLQVLILAGAVARGGYCLAAMAADSEEAESYKVRLRHLLIFVALAEGIGGILQVVLNYF